MWQKVLAVKMNIFKTEENPSIVTTLNNIAGAWSQLGDHRRSLEEHQKVLDLRLTIFKTEEHPDVAQSLNNVGMKISLLGDHDEALRHLHRALEIYKKVYNGYQTHPKITLTLKNIDYVNNKISH